MAGRHKSDDLQRTDHESVDFANCVFVDPRCGGDGSGGLCRSQVASARRWAEPSLRGSCCVRFGLRSGDDGEHGEDGSRHGRRADVGRPGSRLRGHDDPPPPGRDRHGQRVPCRTPKIRFCGGSRRRSPSLRTRRSTSCEGGWRRLRSAKTVPPAEATPQPAATIGDLLPPNSATRGFARRPCLHRRPDVQHRLGDRSRFDNRLLGVIRLGDPVPGGAQPALSRPVACARPRILAGPPHARGRLDRLQFGHVHRHGDQCDQGRRLHRPLSARGFFHARWKRTVGDGSRRRLRLGHRPSEAGRDAPRPNGQRTRHGPVPT